MTATLFAGLVIGVGFLSIALVVQLVIFVSAALTLHGRVAARSAVRAAVLFAIAATLAAIIGAGVDPSLVLPL